MFLKKNMGFPSEINLGYNVEIIKISSFDFVEWIKGKVMRSLKVSHIVLTTEELAQVVMDSLKDIEGSALKFKMFDKLARKYSACGSRTKGGDLGWLESHGQAPELFEATQEAPVGEVRGPVKTKYGYHLFIVTDEATMVDTGKDGSDLPMGAGPGTL